LVLCLKLGEGCTGLSSEKGNKDEQDYIGPVSCMWRQDQERGMWWSSTRTCMAWRYGKSNKFTLGTRVREQLMKLVGTSSKQTRGGSSQPVKLLPQGCCERCNMDPKENWTNSWKVTKYIDIKT